MTKIIGITGGIGSGKSIIGLILSTMGYPVYYSDQEAKWVMNKDPELRKELIAVFGEKTYENNELNRPFLAEKIFTSPHLKDKINELVHPKVRKRFADFVAKQTSPFVFNEAAILFETGGYKDFDATILVVADKETRIQRVMERDNITKEQVEARMNNQWTDEQKLKLANFVIHNNETDLLVPQVLDVLGSGFWVLGSRLS
jgi:dephospho-CoA kinase